MFPNQILEARKFPQTDKRKLSEHHEVVHSENNIYFDESVNSTNKLLDL